MLKTTMNMKVKQYLLTTMLFALAHFGQAHNLEPLHVDGRYLKNPAGDIVTLHGWLSNWQNLYPDFWERLDYEAHFKAWKVTTDSILSAGYKLDYARLHFGDINPTDFDGFVQRGDFDNLILPMVDYLNSKGIYVLLMADIGDDVYGTERSIGELMYQRLLKYWNYVSSHPRIKNNPGVMFELANEPGWFRGSDGSLDDFRTLKAYYQPMVDLIRKNGCQHIIWVPGWCFQVYYAGYATFPIEGENIGYAKHCYDWFPTYDEEWSTYENIKYNFDVEIKPVSNFAPVMVTETYWEGQARQATAETTTTSNWGSVLKRIYDELGNVSWNIYSEGNLMANTGQNTSSLTIYNDPEGTYMACRDYFADYAKTKVTPISQLKAIDVQLADIQSTVYPGDVRPITLMASFADGRTWNVAGDAKWTSSDESVITIERGNMYVKKEGTVEVSGTYTDGTGKTFNAKFTVLSQLFPLTAEGVLTDWLFDTSYEASTHTFSGFGRSEWSYAANPYEGPSTPVRQYNYIGGVDLSAYKYIVVRLSQSPESNACFWVSDDWADGDDPKIWVDLVGKSEILVDLHQEGFDPSHVVRVGIWQYGSTLSVQEIFLSNDGVNPAAPYTVQTVVTANDLTMCYGDDVPELTYTVAGYGNVGTPKLTTTATKTSPVGTYNIAVAASGSADGNISYKPGKLTVVPAPLTVTANDVMVNKGKAIPSLTLAYDGLRNGETAATALSELPTATTTATKDSPVGNYDITVSGGKATNYELVWHNGTLTIAPDAAMTLPADRTAKVATSTEAWDAWGECSMEYAPAVTTADGRVTPMVERYEDNVTTTGIVMKQTVTGLESGEYTVTLCANAYYTDGRGFDSDLKEGAKDVVRLYANNVQQSMTAHIGTSTNKNEEYTLSNVKVIDGSLHIGMEALKPGTNWHTLQIKSLTLTKQYTLSEAFNMALAEANELLPQRMSDRTRNTLQKMMAAEQTYPNYYRLADALQQAHESIEAQAFAARVLEVMKNELLTITNVYTPKAKADYEQFYRELQKAYDEECLTDKIALNELYNPYEGGGGLSWCALSDFLLSVWDYDTGSPFYTQGTPYSINWIEPYGKDDVTSFNKPYIEYHPTEGNWTLDARTLTATMTDMEPGSYTVKAHVRIHSNDGKTPKGITLQLCGGSPVPINSGQQADDYDYIDHYTATGMVSSDGVLTIKFIVAADNNVEWLAFRDLWQFPSKNIGDANSDGKVDNEDVKAIARYIIGQTPANFNKGAADVNGDGNVDIADVAALIELVK